jgi:hypothetical protein
MNAITELVSQLVGWVLSFFGDDERVKKVQELVVVGCGFLPTAASVAAMLAAPNPVVTGVLGVATAICQAINRPPIQLVALADFPILGEVNGIPIDGDFVGGKK